MTHGLDLVETASTAAPDPDAASLLDRMFGWLNSLIVLLSSIALVVAAGVLTYSVITRYFLHLSTDWQDELSVFLIVGAVFMSSAAVQARRGHIGIEAIIGLMSPEANRVRQLVIDFVSFVFCAFFSWKSWTLLEEAWLENYHSSSTWAPPLWIPYSLMTLGMTLLSIQLLLQVAASWRQRRPTA